MSKGDRNKLVWLTVLGLGAILAYFGSTTTLNCQRLSSSQVDCQSTTTVAWIPVDKREFHGITGAGVDWNGSDSGGYYTLYLNSPEGKQQIAPYSHKVICLRCTSWVDSNKIKAFLKEKEQMEFVTSFGYLEDFWIVLLAVIVIGAWQILKPDFAAESESR
jgi:hypothetical protein